MKAVRVHGGPDAGGAVPHDFSSNANACGPCPAALAALQAADAQRYPDPAYAALRNRLGQYHGVPPERIVIGGSGSELIFRFTALAARHGVRRVGVPRHGFGDYAAAAAACQLELDPDGTSAGLVWTCEPSSPLGQADPRIRSSEGHLNICDLAYEPLRLSGTRTPLPARLWQLWTPNKALGLPGVRGAYAVAPEGAEEAVQALDALAPSWVLGAHGVALLHGWCEPPVRPWLEDCKALLREWKRRQVALCESLGWTVLPAQANFFVARAPLDPSAHALLRSHGVQVRDCASFGLPKHVRLAVLPPASQDALRQAVERLR